jgi:hypothetical protein
VGKVAVENTAVAGARFSPKILAKEPGATLGWKLAPFVTSYANLLCDESARQHQETNEDSGLHEVTLILRAVKEELSRSVRALLVSDEIQMGCGAVRQEVGEGSCLRALAVLAPWLAMRVRRS